MFPVFLLKWDKIFSQVAIKAFTKGTLVGVSVSEALASNIDCDSTGLLLHPNNSIDLAVKIE